MTKVRLITVVGVAIALLTACGGRDGREPRLAAATTSAAVATPSPSPSLLDANAGTGQTVQITDGGFRPAWLLSLPGQPITWQNLTDHPVAIAFDHEDASSGPIPPGGSFSWTTQTPITVRYHQVDDPSRHGVVQAGNT